MMGDRSSLRDTAILEHYSLRERFSWKVVFVIEAGLSKKKRRWTPRHCSRVDAPRRLSSPFWIFSRGLGDGFHKSCLTDLCVYGRTRVCGWLIGGTVKSIERQVKKRETDGDECEIEGARQKEESEDSVVIHMHARCFVGKDKIIIMIAIIF